MFIGIAMPRRKDEMAERKESLTVSRDDFRLTLGRRKAGAQRRKMVECASATGLVVWKYAKVRTFPVAAFPVGSKRCRQRRRRLHVRLAVPVDSPDSRKPEVAGRPLCLEGTYRPGL